MKADLTIICNMTLSYRGHFLDTNHAQGIRNFMKLHSISGATQIINLAKAVTFDWIDLVVAGETFTIEKRD